MKKHRIFIAINLSEDVRISLVDYKNKWEQELPAKWTRAENLHITLLFIGDVEEKGIAEVEEAIKIVVEEQKPFLLAVDKISYSPYKQDIEAPKMVWVSGVPPKEFLDLKKNLEKELAKKTGFKPERREAALHITLARIKEWEWRRIEPEERSEIDEAVDFNFQVSSVQLIESVLKRSGPEYTIINSYKLEG